MAKTRLLCYVKNESIADSVGYQKWKEILLQDKYVTVTNKVSTLQAVAEG